MRILTIADMYGIGGRRHELAAALAQAARDFARAPGCLRYTVTAGLEDRDRYVVVAEWDGRAAFQAHYASAAFADFQQALHGLLARPSELTVHTLAESSSPQPSGPLDPRDAD